MTKIAETQADYAPPSSVGGMRVNARLDETTSQELRQLMKETGKSVTEVIRDSIHRLYTQESREARTPAEAFADLIGSLDEQPDLASNYKAVLGATYRAKHG